MAKLFSPNLGFNPISDSIQNSEGDEFRFSPPHGQALPQDGYENADLVYTSPPSTGRNTLSVSISPESERLQRLQPFEPWSGQDIHNAAILIKVKREVHHRPHNSCRPLVQIPWSPREHLKQYTHRRGERRERKGQLRRQPAQRSRRRRSWNSKSVQGRSPTMARDC